VGKVDLFGSDVAVIRVGWQYYQATVDREGAWIAFVFRDAVNPSMDASGETPVSHAPENKHRSTCDAHHNN
jgi:hypothetical protein